jgi:hypothetical protein
MPSHKPRLLVQLEQAVVQQVERQLVEQRLGLAQVLQQELALQPLQRLVA